MNRIITLIVVGLYLFAFNPLAQAQSLPTFSFGPECSTPNPGETFTVDVQVENFENLLGFQYLFTFDETIIQPVLSFPTLPIVTTSVPTVSENPDNIGNLVQIQASYIPGEGVRTSLTASSGFPTTLPSTIGASATIFSISFEVIGAVGDATLIGIDCVNFNCEVIGQNPSTGLAATIATDIMYTEGVVDVGGASNCMTTNGGGTTPTCSDGIQNGTETGVDCGGSCPPCSTMATCTDGIQNGNETGVDCGGSCPPCPTGGTTAPVTITAENPGAPTGSALCIDVAVGDFDDLVGLQYSMHWDPTLFQYDSVDVTGSVLTDISTGNFGESTVNSGTLTFSWNVQSMGGAGITLPDGTVIYQVCFTVLGAGGSVSDFDFDGNPTPPEATAEGMSPTNQINFTDGSLTATGTGGGANAIILTVGSPSADPGETLCIPVTASSFDDIVGFQYSMDWDPNILMFTTTQNYSPNVLNLSSANFNNSAPGDLVVTWNHPSNLPISVDDGEVLYEVCFQVVGNAGQVGTVSFTDMPLDIEVITSTGSDGILTANDGSITITNTGGFNVVPLDVQTCPDDNGGRVCVPFAVTGFNQIAGAQWTVEFDPTVLDFVQSDPNSIPMSQVAAGVSGLSIAGFNENGAQGSVRFSWFESSNPFGATLADNTTFFEMCFDVLGDLNSSTAINITGNNASIEISGFVDGVLVNTIAAGVGSSTVLVSCETTGPSVNVAASTVSDANCGNDGSIAVDVTGGTPNYTYAWSNGQTTQTISNLTPGDYTVTVMDNASGTTSQTFTVGGAAALMPSAVATNETANAAGDGTITLTTTGGTPGYTYAWSNGQTTQTISGLSPAMYTVTITDTNMCTTTASATVGTTITIGTGNPPGGPTGSSVVTDVDCNGANNGSIDLVFSGGVSPFTYNWDNGGGTGEDLSDLGPGTYCVTLTDVNASTVSDCFTIAEPDAITISLVTITNVSAQGFTDGDIDVTVAGGTGNLNYTWLPVGSTATEDLTDQGAGTYTLVVVDANMCSTTSQAFTIEDGPAILSFDAANTVIGSSCAGECTGQINAAVTGGQAPFSYAWSLAGAGDTPNLTDLCPGNYTVTVSDAAGAQTISSILIVNESAAIAGAGTVTHESVAGANDGGVDLNVTGGLSPYAFEWSNTTFMEDLTGVAPGSYTVTITDRNNCTSVETYLVESARVDIDVNGSAVAGVTCFGECTGGINVALVGGQAPFTFAWSPNTGDAFQNVSGLCAGTYSVTVTDANNTTATASFEVQQPSAALTATGVVTNESTSTNDGSIDLSVTGGSPSYTYLWNNGALTQDIQNLGAANYTVTVTDANNCTTVANFTVNPAVDPLVVSTTQSTVTDASCNGGNDGAISIAITGGLPPFDYAWSNGAMTKDIAQLTAGTYIVTVTDALNTVATQSFLVGQAPAMQITCTPIPETSSGNDGGINLNVTGGTPGYTYEWSTAGGNVFSTNQNIANQASGTYTVVVTDANGCTQEEDCTIQGIFGTSAVTITDVDCFGANSGSINITTFGGRPPYAWIWTNAANTTVALTEDLNNQPAGTYTVVMTDDNGQTFTDTYTIDQPNTALAIANATVVDQIAPNFGSINITVNGGTAPYSYNWSNGSSTEDLNNLTLGCYSVTIIDANNCIVESPEYCIEYEPIPLSINGAMASEPACNGGGNGSIALSIDGGDASYTIAWGGNDVVISQSSPFSYTINNLAPGTYIATITDSNGQVETTDPIVISEPDPITITPIINAITDCPGNGSINLNGTATQGGTAPYTYSWNGPGFTANTASISNLDTPGEYFVTIMDANGCSESLPAISIEMDVPQLALTVGASSIMNVDCPEDEEGFIDLVVSGGFCLDDATYLWNTGDTTQDLPNQPAGIYNVTVTDGNGTSTVGEFTIQTSSNLAIDGTIVTSLGVNNGFGVSSYGACDGTASVLVSSGNGITITWCNGQIGPNANSLCEGDCAITVMDALGCTLTTSVTLTADPGGPGGDLTVLPQNINIDAACGEDCNGSILVQPSGGAPPYTYTWSSNFGNTQFVDDLCPGDYSVTVIDTEGTSVFRTITVEESELTLSFQSTNPTSAAATDGAVTVNVSGGSGEYTYQWNDTNMTTSPTVSGLSSGTYWVIVIDTETGCEATNNVTISDSQADCLAARDIITPNQDACNDEFAISCLNQFASNTLEIYNRWGQLVYEVENYDCILEANATASGDICWIGQNRRGQDLPAGAYFYVLVGTYADGTTEQIKGSITVLRDE